LKRHRATAIPKYAPKAWMTMEPPISEIEKIERRMYALS